VRLDDVLHDAQPDSHPLGLAPQLGAAPVEALEDALVLGGRDAFAVVLDPEQKAWCAVRGACGVQRAFVPLTPHSALRIPHFESYCYRVALGRVLEGVVNEGDEIFAGDVISKMPRETTKTKDITGGLPRVAELFEARKPKENAIVTEINGVVTFGKMAKGKREIIVTPDTVHGEPRKYTIPRGKHVIVHEGDYVRAGEPLMDGPVNPHDVLRILGIKDLARYLVDEIQEVYQLQGVKINDKHIETIVRQMLKRVRIKDIGDTNFIIDDYVEWWVFEEENRRVLAEGGKPAQAEPLFLGITKASLITDSFISAASFQDTTKVLTQASIEGRVDYLRGLKENVIMGRIIPAGTGYPKYRNYDMNVLDKPEELPEEEVLPELAN